MKLDIGLVRKIDHDDVRQALVAGIVYFARKSGCQLIAEGIETTGERTNFGHLGWTWARAIFWADPLRRSE